MAYEHDIFISYRHDCPTTPWIMGVFLPELTKRLIPKRPERIRIFSDLDIRAGAKWAKLLPRKVASSQILIPMLTPYYFGSEWCRRELALMMEREETLGLNLDENSETGLVIPVRLCDGEKFPDRIGEIQHFCNFGNYTMMRKGTKTWTQFQQQMDRFSDEIDELLDLAPDFNDSFMTLTGKGIETELKAKIPKRSPLLRLSM